MLRVLFDTSSLVGAAPQIGSVPHLALRHALAATQLCASPATLSELQRVLRRQKFDRYQPAETRKEFFDIVARAAVVYEVSQDDMAAVMPGCRDPEDDKFLALASVCQADVISAVMTTCRCWTLAHGTDHETGGIPRSARLRRGRAGWRPSRRRKGTGFRITYRRGSRVKPGMTWIPDRARDDLRGAASGRGSRIRSGMTGAAPGRGGHFFGALPRFSSPAPSV